MRLWLGNNSNWNTEETNQQCKVGFLEQQPLIQTEPPTAEVIALESDEEKEVKGKPVIDLCWSDEEDFQPAKPGPSSNNKRKEGPCSPSPATKKSRSALPSPPPPEDIPVRKKKDPSPVRIFYTTRTHSQITKAVQELGKTAYRPLLSILGSRKQYCIHPKVSKLSNKDSEW